MRCLPADVLHQLCLTHGIHLAVCDILYKKNLTAPDEIDVDVKVENENSDDEDDETEVNIAINVDVEPELIPTFSDIIKQVWKISKFFRKSPVRNEEYLQPLVKQSFGEELTLHIDVVTRWNSLLKMLKRFYKLRIHSVLA